MAEPRLGKDGSVLIGAATAATITDWELSVNQDALEKTSFGDGWDRTYTAGLRGPVATVNGYYSDTDAAQVALTALIHSTSTPAPVTVVLLTVSTTGSKAGWTGSAIPQLTIGAGQDGIDTISGTFQFSGGVSVYST